MITSLCAFRGPAYNLANNMDVTKDNTRPNSWVRCFGILLLTCACSDETSLVIWDYNNKIILNQYNVKMRDERADSLNLKVKRIDFS